LATLSVIRFVSLFSHSFFIPLTITFVADEKISLAEAAKILSNVAGAAGDPQDGISRATLDALIKRATATKTSKIIEGLRNLFLPWC